MNDLTENDKSFVIICLEDVCDKWRDRIEMLNAFGYLAEAEKYRKYILEAETLIKKFAKYERY